MKKYSILLVLGVSITGCNGSGTSVSILNNENINQCATIPTKPDNPDITQHPVLNSPKVWSFVSESKLHPMKVQVNVYESGVSPDFIFVDPFTFSDVPTYGQTGSLIFDNDGTPIWFRPLSSTHLMNNNFQVQELYGNPVLTFWQGTIASLPAYTNLPTGTAEPGACYYILDNNYKTIQTVTAQNGYTSDLHEFVITPKNTALFTSTKVVPQNSSAYNLPYKYVEDDAIQEIDLKTGKLIFFWDIMDHIPLSDSYFIPKNSTATGDVWDAYHINSISLTDNDDEIIISVRNTWAVYKINKTTGNIVWQLGGKRSSFTIESGAEFSWQHDARILPDNKISLFDDNCCETVAMPSHAKSAHGLIVQLDFANMTAYPEYTYYHDPLIYTFAQGSFQNLSNSKFISWGSAQNFSEYLTPGNSLNDPTLNMVYNAQMPESNLTYRALKHQWVGTPYYPPSIAVITENDYSTIYASWNGSTETVYWQVLAGDTINDLSVITQTTKNGFETSIKVNKNSGPYFQVKALDINQNIIGTSEMVQLSH